MSWWLFVLGTLAAYRLWRLVALDDLPGWRDAIEAVDRWVSVHAGDRWADGISCPWCSGWWCCVAVFAIIDATGTPVPLPLLQMAAASTLVGLIGSRIDA